MNFHRGIPEQKFNVNRAYFPKQQHQNSQKWAKFMNFSFWPFLWFGLSGRLLSVARHLQVKLLHPLERDRVSEVQTTRDTLQGVRDGVRQGSFGVVQLQHPCATLETAERAAMGL